MLLFDRDDGPQGADVEGTRRENYLVGDMLIVAGLIARRNGLNFFAVVRQLRFLGRTGEIAVFPDRLQPCGLRVECETIPAGSHVGRASWT